MSTQTPAAKRKRDVTTICPPLAKGRIPAGAQVTRPADGNGSMAKPRAREVSPLRPPARITRQWSWPQQLGDRDRRRLQHRPRQRPQQCRHREFGDGNTVTVIGGNSSATAQLGDGNTATTTVIGGGSALASLGDGNTVIVRGDGLFAPYSGQWEHCRGESPAGSTIMPGASARRAGATGAESQKPGVAGLGGPTSISTARRRLSRITRCLPGPVCRERPEVGDLQAHLAVARSAGVGVEGREGPAGRRAAGTRRGLPLGRLRGVQRDRRPVLARCPIPGTGETR